jgi:hypothetical protein
VNRRQLLLTGLAALAGWRTSVSGKHPGSSPQSIRGGIPLIHVTDLYHPPQDPDDHIDLATLVALDEFDVKGVILDVTRKFLDAAPAGADIARDPGLVPVAQLAYLLGRSLPSAISPTSPLARPEDDARDRPLAEQSGIALMLDILEDSTEPVVVSVVGSARVVTAAFNRHPELLRARVRYVLLNAGSTGGLKREWNVGLDPEAYIGLWRSGLPIRWYPCATERGAFQPADERGTYWKTTHGAIFRNLTPPVRAWFQYALSGDRRGDVIRVLSEEGEQGETWKRLLPEPRNLWATASLVMAAGRILGRTPEGWRFVPAAHTGVEETWPWRLDLIRAAVRPDASILWQRVDSGGNAELFGRREGVRFADVMAEALADLLARIPVGE